MKTITLHVNEDDYAALQNAAREQKRPTSALVREAMSLYRTQNLSKGNDLRNMQMATPRGVKRSLHTREDMLDDFLDRGAS